ncbi:VOC family protein [Paenibacillus glycanilyticus]|uniref:Lactoylglutathione lyase n=1 Tax=Paenibacillus glycanilyticus TaxID=126569 RepID=A0ABQ6GF20_9BACL|nr:VOC family protein [Paenibacillus glycanilyticus]GLX68680.1 lactoylglutathione lyase [Paenibacillus glycanilyticus]
MINQLGQVMLYVNDQEKAREFWTEKVGFKVVAEEEAMGQKWIELAPEGAQTSIILHDKEVVAKMSLGVNLGTPSLMFFSDKLDELYNDFKNKNVTVGELVELPFGRVFNFADDEDNYFAIMERK